MMTTTITMAMTTGTMMTTKRRRGIRFPGTRLGVVLGSVIAFLAIWLQIASSSTPDAAGLSPGTTDAAVQSRLTAEPASQGRVPTRPVPRRAVSRGS